MRFGGSGNDNLVYGLSPGSPECAAIVPTTACDYVTPGCLNASHWEALYGFANNSNAKVVFGLAFGLEEACAQGASYSWNASNAATLLAYLHRHGQQVFGFELGNEINNNGGAPCNLTASQQAAAVRTLYGMLRDTMPDAKLIGPDTGYREPQEWLTAFLPLVKDELYAVTHHVYPGIGRTNFNHPQSLDKTLPEIKWYTKIIADNAPKAQVWAGEDGPTGGGDDGTCGHASVCSTYASALWYADDLANRAKHGFVQYQRQDFIGGAYGLVDSAMPHYQTALGLNEALKLRPGYWVNFLYKRTVGTQVLNASSSSSIVRSYAYSNVPPSKHAAEECVAMGAVQLLLINLQNATNATAHLTTTQELTYAAWTLTPPRPAAGAIDAFSNRTLLNGQMLPDTVEDGTASFLDGIPVAARTGDVADGLVLPPLSVSFVCVQFGTQRRVGVSPPPPIPDIDDAYYPMEEASELAEAAVPSVRSTSTKDCQLEHAGTVVTASVGDLVFGTWTVQGLLPGGAVVLERQWRRWGLIVSATVAGVSRMLRKPLGKLDQTRTSTYNLSAIEPNYFHRAASEPDDYIGQRILNESVHREASFLTAAKFLPPIADYVVIGDTHAPVKAVATMDGKIKRSDGADAEPMQAGAPIACTSSDQCRQPPRDRSYCFQGSCVPGGGTIFDAAAYLGFKTTSSVDHWDEMQTGVLGGHMRVASIACFNRTASGGQGFEMMALGPLHSDNDTVLIALRPYITGAPPNASFTYLSVSLDRRACTGIAPTAYCSNAAHPCCTLESSQFYSAVFEHAAMWDFAAAMTPSIPYAERRQIDMARGVLVAGSTVWIGDQPNYGTGGNYWRGSPPVRSMMDTSQVPGSLPLTSLALDTALLQWGLTNSALAKVGFYFDTFIYPNGTVDMGHWKDVWRDGGDGVYNCTFPDGLSDMGRMLQLFADAVRHSRNTTWMVAHLPGAMRIGHWLLRARAAAVAAHPPADLRHGIIAGPAEHDTCTMGMGNGNAPAVPVVDGQRMLFYFSSSMQSWRGMLELGTLLRDYPNAVTPAGAALGAALLDEAPRFKSDIDAALAASVVKDTSGRVRFVPAAVAPTKWKKPLPYKSMTADTLASYSNFRYYAEMLSAGFLDEATSIALQAFREAHGGTLSGMTRYTDHLDDMPAIGYAVAALETDRIDKYLLLLYGHAANYQGRGSFFTTEQQSLYEDAARPSWRATLGEIQADFCTPSQTLVASMTAMQLVYGERDQPVLWLARAAPRRWYAGSGSGEAAFGVRDAPSRWGLVSFNVSRPVGNVTRATLTVDFSQPHGARVHAPTIHLRLRDPDARVTLTSATAGGADDCEVVEVRAAAELVVVQASTAVMATGRIRSCTVMASFV